MINIKLMASAEISAALGTRLKGQRLTLRMTQAELAERSGLNVGTVKNLEAKTATCSLDTLIRIALVLGVVDQLAGLFVATPKSIAQMEQIATAPRTRARGRRHQ